MVKAKDILVKPVEKQSRCAKCRNRGLDYAIICAFIGIILVFLILDATFRTHQDQSTGTLILTHLPNDKLLTHYQMTNF